MLVAATVRELCPLQVKLAVTCAVRAETSAKSTAAHMNISIEAAQCMCQLLIYDFAG
jgi:hypothetical protein